MRRRRSTSASSGISTRNGRIEPFDAAAWFGARKLKTPPEARSAADVASAEFARNFRRVGDDESMDILVLPVLMTRRFLDRKSAVKGKSVSVRVDLGGRRIIKKN